LKLPNLKKLVFEGMAYCEDWELAKMMDYSSESLTELRIKHCRLLGDYQQWFESSAESLSVLELIRPSESFNVPNFQRLFVEGKLRDISICEASGLQGDICGLLSSPRKAVSDMIKGRSIPKVEGEKFMGSPPSQTSNLRLGGGSIDETSTLAQQQKCSEDGPLKGFCWTL
jgi:hypothetical protein